MGQVGRELLPPDELRAAEVAREMLENGNYIVPHLAGLPFVEKPPGFQAMIASGESTSSAWNFARKLMCRQVVGERLSC